MHRSYPNLVPVTNKYLAHKQFIKEQEEHQNNIKHARGLLDQTSPTSHPHCYERVRQKQIKEHQLAVIKHEDERLRARMVRNGAYVDTHNNYVAHSLNVEKRHRNELQHKHEVDRLHKQLEHTRTNYPTRAYQNDYVKQRDLKLRISRFPPNNK